MNPTKSSSSWRGEILRRTIRVAQAIGLVGALQRFPALYRPLRTLLFPAAGNGDSQEIITGPLAGYRMVLGPSDRRAYLVNAHEPDIVQLTSDLCRPGMHILDIGAHVGYFSLLFSVRSGPTGLVTTLEPNPHNVAKVRAMAAANGLTNIAIHPLAASDQDGSVEFFTEETGQMGHMVDARNPGQAGLVKVQAARIDSLCADGRLGRVDLIKLDVEGAEVKALAGMAGLLQRCQPVIICEWHPAVAGPDFATTFKSLGYQCELLEPASDTTPFHLLARPAGAARPTT